MSKRQRRKNIQLDIKETIEKLQNQIRLKHWDQATYTGNKLNFLINDLRDVDNLILKENTLFAREVYLEQSRDLMRSSHFPSYLKKHYKPR
ncbi:hypothetical protein AADZ84_17150 [Colwelliaceae bacterium MEBiC 14330]